MSWVILTGRQSDLDQVATPHKVITTRDYLAHRRCSAASGRRSSTCRAASPIRAAATMPRCSPRRAATASSRRVETMVDLGAASSTPRRCPNSTALYKCRKDLGGERPGQGLLLFRHRPVQGLGPLRAAAVRLVPLRRSLEVSIQRRAANGRRSARSACPAVTTLSAGRAARFHASAPHHTSREWRDTKARRRPATPSPCSSIRNEEMPPSRSRR